LQISASLLLLQQYWNIKYNPTYLVTLLLYLIQHFTYYCHFEFLSWAWPTVSKPTDRQFTPIRLLF